MYQDKQASYGHSLLRAGGYGVDMAQTAAAAAMAAQQSPPERTHEVPDELDRMERALGQLESSVFALDARLAPVARPPAPSDANGTLCAANPITGYAASMRIQSERVQSLSNRLADLLYRLEV
jgi:hypothetical protein